MTSAFQQLFRKQKIWTNQVKILQKPFINQILILTGIDAVRQTKGVAEAAICYTGDLSAVNGGGKYNLDYYLNLARVLYFSLMEEFITLS